MAFISRIQFARISRIRVSPLLLSSSYTTSAAAGPAIAAPSRRIRWSRLLAGATALALTAHGLKTYIALRPLFSEPDKEPAAVAREKEAAATRKPRESLPGLLHWGWLFSEASERLIRDVYVAFTIVDDYMRHRSLEDWGEIHQRGADRLLKLCQARAQINHFS